VVNVASEWPSFSFGREITENRASAGTCWQLVGRAVERVPDFFHRNTPCVQAFMRFCGADSATLHPVHTPRTMFSPDAVGQANGHLFGIPCTPEAARIVLIPVPWAATVSYHSGAEDGPAAILDASPQLDFYHPQAPDVWKLGFALLDVPASIRTLSDATRPLVQELIALLEGRDQGTPQHTDDLRQQINLASTSVNNWVNATAQFWLKKGKLVAVVGGEHSSPLGLLHALGEHHPDGFGILQIDAHADLRDPFGIWCRWASAI
jgi:Arginase family